MRDAGIAPTAATATRWGCSVGTGMMGVAYEDLSAVQRHSAADGELHADQLVTIPRRPTRSFSVAARRRRDWRC